MSDPSPLPWFDIVIILALVLLNGVLSMSELAIVSSREARLKAMAKSGSSGAQCALDLAANPAEHVGSMVTGGLAEYARAVDHTAALWVVSAKAEGFHASKRHRASAHRARLQCHPDRTTVEARLTELLGGRTDGDDLCMRSRVETSAHRIARLGDDLAALGDDRSDGHLPVLGCLAGEVERAAHRQGQRKTHREAANPRRPPCRFVDYCAVLVTGCV
jgi:hypothetical protein